MSVLTKLFNFTNEMPMGKEKIKEKRTSAYQTCTEEHRSNKKQC